MKKDNTKGKFIVLLILALCILFIAFFASKIVPYDPYAPDLHNTLQPPSSTHFFGTDLYGRDVFSRVIVGSKTSVFSALALVTVISVVGSFIGMFSGLKGGKIDALIMRISDVFLAFPTIVFAIAVVSVLGGGITNAIIALAVISWPKYARIARGQVLSMKEMPFILAARLSGSSTLKIIGSHIVSVISGPILVTAMLDIGTILMEIAGLSFLGLGVQPPTAEWGSMMSNGRSMIQTSPWVILAPGFAIFITVAIFNLLGDTIRDLLDLKKY